MTNLNIYFTEYILYINSCLEYLFINSYSFMYIHSHVSPAKDSIRGRVYDTSFPHCIMPHKDNLTVPSVVTYLQHKLDTTWRRCLLVPVLCACESRQGTLIYICIYIYIYIYKCIYIYISFKGIQKHNT